MPNLRNLAALALFAMPALAQSQPCSASTVADDTQVFACSGMKGQSAAILAILNKIANDKLDPGSVLAKLNEVPKGAGARYIQLTEVQKKEPAGPG